MDCHLDVRGFEHLGMMHHSLLIGLWLVHIRTQADPFTTEVSVEVPAMTDSQGNVVPFDSAGVQTG